MPRKYSDSKRDYVRFRYVVKGENPEEISEAEGGEPVARTIRQWAAEEGWDDLRTLRRTSKHTAAIRIRRMVDRALEKLEDSDQLPPTSDGDGIYKWLKAADMLDSSVERTSVGLELLDDLNAWLVEKDPHLADQIAPLLGVYAQELVQEAV